MPIPLDLPVSEQLLKRLNVENKTDFSNLDEAIHGGYDKEILSLLVNVMDVWFTKTWGKKS
jgi:hypothetical protein